MGFVMLLPDYLSPGERNKDRDFAVKQSSRRHSCYGKDGLDTHPRRGCARAGNGGVLQGQGLPRETLREAERS